MGVGEYLRRCGLSWDALTRKKSLQAVMDEVEDMTDCHKLKRCLSRCVRPSECMYMGFLFPPPPPLLFFSIAGLRSTQLWLLKT